MQTKQSAVELLKELKKYYTYENIASVLGRTFQTIYAWGRGKRNPSFGDFTVMTGMLDSIKKDGRYVSE